MGDISDFYESQLGSWYEADYYEENTDDDKGIWINSKGEAFTIRNMTTNHLFNSLKYARGIKVNEIKAELRSRFYKV